MRVLCVAEKPSQARSVVQILSNGSFTTRNGRSRYNKNFDFQYRISGTFEQATMTSVAGHVTELDFPLNVRRWQSCNPLCLFTSPIVESIEERTRDIASNLELEARAATHLYIWTDCDREGEGIGYEVAEICRKVNPRIIVLRAHFSSVLPQEIHNAMQNPRGLDMRLVEAVRARAELDLRIGSALTRFQTLRLRSRFAAVEEKLISYGPCQFPTLGFVVDQFLRVESFVPETFWYIYLEHVKDDGKAVFTWRRQRLFDQEVCFAFYAQCVQTPLARVVSARMRPQEKWRPLPLTTVELQKCCARFLRMSPDNIMSVAEGLYNQGFVSYPRTETDQFDRNMDLRGIVAKLTQYPPFAEYAQKLGNGGFQWPRHGRNNDKAHPPIHPVAAAPNLTGDAKRVYEFITRRFLACCSQNAKGNATEVEVQVASERFNTKGLAIVARNYLEIYPYDRWAESTVPVYNEGDTFEPSVMEMRNGTTTAPRLLSEADLVDAMEKNGIGTDATHADHIKKIIDREYIFKGPDGRLTPSTLGVGLVEGYDSIGLELSLSKPYLRREMERELKQICEGTKTKSEVIRESINLYQAVYSKSVEEFGRLEQALSRCLQEEPRAGGWMPQGTTVGSDEVAKCPTCPEGALSLRARANGGGWMVGCSMYPQCHRVIWLPNIISAASVSDDNCAQCAQMNRGSVKLLDLKFRPGSLPPGAPSPYRGCILGCDELLSELFDIRPTTTGAGRSQPTQSQPNVSLQSQNGTMPARPPPSLAPAPAPAPAQQPSSNSFTLSDNPLCNCGILSAQRTVSRESANRGRPFYACSKPQETRCDFFQWADQPPPSAPPLQPSFSNYNNGSGSINRRHSPSPSAQFSDTTVKPQCKCGLYTALRQKQQDNSPNSGREYYVCTRSYQGCGFVCWKDDAAAYIAGAMSRPVASGSNSAAASSECFKCHQMGHWSRDCPNAAGMTVEAPQRPPPASSTGRRGRGRGGVSKPRRGRGRGRGRGSRSSRANNSYTDSDPSFEFWN